MSYYVVYRNREIVEGPLPKYRADAICEDLDMAFEDPGYKVLEGRELLSRGLELAPKYHIQEDTPE